MKIDPSQLARAARPAPPDPAAIVKPSGELTQAGDTLASRFAQAVLAKYGSAPVRPGDITDPGIQATMRALAPVQGVVDDILGDPQTRSVFAQ